MTACPLCVFPWFLIPIAGYQAEMLGNQTILFILRDVIVVYKLAADCLLSVNCFSIVHYDRVLDNYAFSHLCRTWILWVYFTLYLKLHRLNAIIVYICKIAPQLCEEW